MRSRFHYVRPTSLDEALRFLESHGPESAVLAGGTDLMIAVRKGDLNTRFVMDISRLPELAGIQEREIDGAAYVRIGAGVTHAEIAGSSQLMEHAPVLVTACARVGSVQIRNQATLAGNVVNASPAADGIPPLVAHDARVLVQSSAGRQAMELPEFIAGPYRTVRKAQELVTGILIPVLGAGYGYAYERVARRRALSIARINLAVIGKVAEDGQVLDLRIAPGSVTPVPVRMTAAERVIVGKRLSRELIEQAATRVSSEMIRQSGVRPSTEYKKPVVEGLLARALRRALEH